MRLAWIVLLLAPSTVSADDWPVLWPSLPERESFPAVALTPVAPALPAAVPLPPPVLARPPVDALAPPVKSPCGRGACPTGNCPRASNYWFPRRGR